ncbi:hypothetical protein SAY86_004322 [Trapa natans]|uniref:mitogen-activated protein kinase n=1 Tax=Trapa natans TaxID=22666 RepID=A0AAN7MYI1_TRANT|nr:hypothetical protein SAY86_004322 [Trapa natans]
MLQCCFGRSDYYLFSSLVKHLMVVLIFKVIVAANVYHRDLKPKNILANANCKLKVCDFGLARVAFSDTPITIFWTDYVATRWYRAPELCGSFFSKYTPAIDIWGVGCIFAEVLIGKPLFPGKSVVHQLDLITDLLGTPSSDTISGVKNEKARKYLTEMRKKECVPFSEKFPNADPRALKLLQRLLAFDPRDRPTAEEALADPYFKGLAKVEREPSCQPISKLEFEFERLRVTKEDIRELLYREILEYHPQLLKDYMNGSGGTNFLYPSAVGQVRRQFAHLEECGGRSAPVIPLERKHVSLPRPTVHSRPVTANAPGNGSLAENRESNEEASKNPNPSYSLDGNPSRAACPPPRVPAKPSSVVGPVLHADNVRDNNDPRFYQNAGYPQSISPQCYLRPQAVAHEKPTTDPSNTSTSREKFVNPASHLTEISGNTYFTSKSTIGQKLNERIAMEAKMFQVQSQFGKMGTVAMAAHRNVGSVQYG